MATMDKQLALAATAISRLRENVGNLEEANFVRQRTLADRFKQFGYWVDAFVILMVLGAIYYGKLIMRQMQLASQERQRHRLELQTGIVTI